MRATTAVLICVLVSVLWFIPTGVARGEPCEIDNAVMWMRTADEESLHQSDPRYYTNVRDRFSDWLDVYDYPFVFRQLEQELEEWMLTNGPDGPHENLLHALRLLNGGLADSDYGQWLAELSPQSDEELKEAAQQFADELIEDYGTGQFQFKSLDTDCGWFPAEYGVTCSEIENMEDCLRAEDFLYRYHTIQQLVNAFKKAAVLETVEGIRMAASRWEHFLADGKTMYPWEAGLNAWWVGGGTTQYPPMHQWVLLHPQISVSLSTESLADVTARDAFCVEVLGHIWYQWHDESQPQDGIGWWGISAIAVFRDDMRPGAGLALEYGRMMTLGVAWHDDDEDNDWFDNAPYFVMSVDLLSFTQEKAQQYREFSATAQRELSGMAGW
jgi:hypothetical protein